ncbi:adenylyl-sulfate kinase [Mycobacterium marinum]|uniref:adenylyl-sulfate kinase n=1 Tax=Mycobacterium marinum TaxID=1781 RepID=UPI0035651C56
MGSNITWHNQGVTRRDRERLNGHRGCVLWFTGLSASGKSTVANLVDQKLYERAVRSYLLDGDNVRHGLNAGPDVLEEGHGEGFARRFGLGFSAEDREENIRRIGAVAKLFCDAAIVALTAFISPYRRDRDAVRATLSANDFMEIFVDTPIEICERRDPKWLYRKVRAGQIKGFTGVDSPYEVPLNPELRLNGGKRDADSLAIEVVSHLESMGVIPALTGRGHAQQGSAAV